jgi:hypothetical protein
MDKFKELKELAGIEIANLERLCQEMNELLSVGVEIKRSIGGELA